MLTSSVLFAPSVPTMLIDEQRGDHTEMIEAVHRFGERLGRQSPAAIVVVTPRWVSAGAFQADDAKQHRSVVDLPDFGVEPRYDCEGQPALARAIVEQAAKSGVRAALGSRGIDSGAGIPLHFLARARRIPVVPLSLGEGSREEHRAWGAAIRHALDAWPDRVAFVVGGALSWNLHAASLKRDVRECHELDERVLEALRRGTWSQIETLVNKLGAKAAPEAGLLHLEVLRGFLLGDSAFGDVIQYEDSPGIGTALVEFPLDPDHEDDGY